MKFRHGFFIVYLVCFQFGLQQSLGQRAQKQTTFCEDGAPDAVAFKAESLPKPVIDAVMNSDEGKQARTDASQAGEELNPEKVLRASKIPLSSDNATVFLIMGSYPLSAADASWFWIVREDGTKASVLLWMAGNCAELKRSSTRGYRDIRVLWASAGSARNEIYRYDGKTYQLVHSKTKMRRSTD